MRIALQVEPESGPPPAVEYRWDPDTDILSARLHPVGDDGAAGSVEVAGDDGSWLILDLTAGRLAGIEVAVWPDVRRSPRLRPPEAALDGRAVVRPPRGGGVTALEMSGAVLAESDADERTIHFRLDGAERARTLRVGRDLLLDLDADSRLAGVWLLNVPPCPLDA